MTENSNVIQNQPDVAMKIICNSVGYSNAVFYTAKNVYSQCSLVTLFCWHMHTQCKQLASQIWHSHFYQL